MNRAYWESMMIDYLDDQLPTEKREELELALQKQPELQLMFDEFQLLMSGMEKLESLEPSTQLDQKFYAFLEEEQQASPKSKRTQLKANYKMLFQVAAALALILMIAAVTILVSQQNKIDALAVEMKKKEDNMLALLKAQSVSNRIKAVNISYKMSSPNDLIISSLIKVMNTDKSSNVRLAAIEALHKFADDFKVKNALVESLHQQTDPSLQIVLINILVELKEESVIDQLESIINDAEVKEVVKDEAHLGLFKLS